MHYKSKLLTLLFFLFIGMVNAQENTSDFLNITETPQEKEIDLSYQSNFTSLGLVLILLYGGVGIHLMRNR